MERKKIERKRKRNRYQDREIEKKK